jgi:hypothetical protein
MTPLTFEATSIESVLDMVRSACRFACEQDEPQTTHTTGNPTVSLNLHGTIVVAYEDRMKELWLLAPSVRTDGEHLFIQERSPGHNPLPRFRRLTFVDYATSVASMSSGSDTTPYTDVLHH